MSLEKEWPVFPLPNVVLFPNALLPLHVFEPRYRALVQSALETSRKFVIGSLKPGYEENYYGSPDVHSHGCLGEIVEHEFREDGRSDLVLRGMSVVEFREFVSEEPFRVARVREQPSDSVFIEGPDAGERVRDFHELLEAACPGCLQALSQRTPTSPKEREGALSLLHTIAMHLPASVEEKVRWLTCENSLVRWESIRASLQGIANEQDRRRRTIERYSDRAPSEPRHN